MFIEEKLRDLGIDTTLPNKFCITNYSNKVVIIEGKINLISFSSTLIKLNIGKLFLSIIGENLMIRDYSISSLVIMGKITEIK